MSANCFPEIQKKVALELYLIERKLSLLSLGYNGMSIYILAGPEPTPNSEEVVAKNRLCLSVAGHAT